MTLDRLRPRPSAAWGALLATAILAVTLGAARPAAAATVEMVGTFRVAPGRCDGAASGSYFRMILPSGSLQGPWIDNADSRCGDRTYTLLEPGTDGGLVSGRHQPAPKPAFDGDGNSLATRVIDPVRFFGVDFSASTEPTDLQTGATTPAPTVRNDGGRLSGELRGFDATWNKQAFNQGSPKPDGSRPGLTGAVSGTYDATSGAYVLTWTSQIVGGPFDGFTGLWHLEGTFVPTASGASGGSGGSSPGVAAAPGSTVTGPGPGPDAPAATADPAPELDAADEAAAPDGAPVAAVSRDAVRVDDDAYSAPVWLVVALAAIGIAGVVCLLVLGRRSEAVAG